jgi:hypothetical protein
MSIAELSSIVPLENVSPLLEEIFKHKIVQHVQPASKHRALPVMMRKLGEFLLNGLGQARYETIRHVFALPATSSLPKFSASAVVENGPMRFHIGELIRLSAFTGGVIGHTKPPPVILRCNGKVREHLMAMSYDGVALGAAIGMVGGRVMGLMPGILEKLQVSTMEEAALKLAEMSPGEANESLQGLAVREGGVYSVRRIDFAISGVVGVSMGIPGGTMTKVKEETERMVFAVEAACARCSIQGISCLRKCGLCAEYNSECEACCEPRQCEGCQAKDFVCETAKIVHVSMDSESQQSAYMNSDTGSLSVGPDPFHLAKSVRNSAHNGIMQTPHGCVGLVVLFILQMNDHPVVASLTPRDGWPRDRQNNSSIGRLAALLDAMKTETPPLGIFVRIYPSPRSDDPVLQESIYAMAVEGSSTTTALITPSSDGLLRFVMQFPKTRKKQPVTTRVRSVVKNPLPFLAIIGKRYFIALDSVVMTSRDRGQTWQEVHIDARGPFFAIAAARDERVLLLLARNGTLHHFHLSDDNTCTFEKLRITNDVIQMAVSTSGHIGFVSKDSPKVIRIMSARHGVEETVGIPYPSDAGAISYQLAIDDARRIYLARGSRMLVWDSQNWHECFTASADGHLADGALGDATSFAIEAVATDGASIEVVDGGVLRLFSPWKAVEFYLELIRNLLDAGGCSERTDSCFEAAVAAAQAAADQIQQMDTLQQRRVGRKTGQTDTGTFSNSVRKGVVLLAKRMTDIFNAYSEYDIAAMALGELESEKIFSISHSMANPSKTTAMTCADFAVGIGRTAAFLLETSQANTGSALRRLTKSVTSNKMYVNAHRKRAAIIEGGTALVEQPALASLTCGDEWYKLNGAVRRIAASANDPRGRTRVHQRGDPNERLLVLKHVRARMSEPSALDDSLDGSAAAAAASAEVGQSRIAPRRYGETRVVAPAAESDDDDDAGDMRGHDKSTFVGRLPRFHAGQLVAVVAPNDKQGNFWLARVTSDVLAHQDRLICQYYELVSEDDDQEVDDHDEEVLYKLDNNRGDAAVKEAKAVLDVAPLGEIFRMDRDLHHELTEWAGQFGEERLRVRRKVRSATTDVRRQADRAREQGEERRYRTTAGSRAARSVAKRSKAASSNPE